MIEQSNKKQMKSYQFYRVLQTWNMKMVFPEHSVPGNQSPLADKTFTVIWGNWQTGAGLDLELETEFSAIL